MPIKVADLLENIDAGAALIDISAGVSTTNSQIAGLGIFGSAGDWSTWGYSDLQPEGYLSIVKQGSSEYRSYIYHNDAGSWGTATNHDELVLASRVPELVKVTDFTDYTVQAGTTLQEQLGDNFDEHQIIIHKDGDAKSKRITVEELFAGFAITIVNENISAGAGTIVSYGGSSDSGGLPADLNGDGIVNSNDLLLLLGAWEAISAPNGPSRTTFAQTWATTEGNAYVTLGTNLNVSGGSVIYFNVDAVSGTTVSQTEPNGSQIGYVVDGTNDRIRFTDGTELEIATGYGSAGPGKYEVQEAVFTCDLNGTGQGYLVFGIEVGRKVSNTYTYYNMLTGAAAFNLPNAGFINSSNQSGFVIADNADGAAWPQYNEAGPNQFLDPFNLSGTAITPEGHLNVLGLFEQAVGEPLYNQGNIQEISFRFWYGGSIAGTVGTAAGPNWKVKYGPI